MVPALQGLRLLLDDLGKIREAPRTIEDLRDSIQSVELALTCLRNISDKDWEALGNPVTEQAKAAISTCNRACNLFRTNLQRWTRYSSEGKLSRLD